MHVDSRPAQQAFAVAPDEGEQREGRVETVEEEVERRAPHLQLSLVCPFWIFRPSHLQIDQVRPVRVTALRRPSDEREESEAGAEEAWKQVSRVFSSFSSAARRLELSVLAQFFFSNATCERAEVHPVLEHSFRRLRDGEVDGHAQSESMQEESGWLWDDRSRSHC